MDDVFYTAKEVADITKKNVQSIRRMARKGELGAVKLRGKGDWLFPKSEIEKSLKSGGVKEDG